MNVCLRLDLVGKKKNCSSLSLYSFSKRFVIGHVEGKVTTTLYIV